ncbi:MAG: hypothetical protein JWM57_467 [Phycisphaerales bacterium]|nr:hypothetical protein [Phycisphaerales bacterium]
MGLLGILVATLAAVPASSPVAATSPSTSRPTTRAAATRRAATQPATTQSLATVDPAALPLLAQLQKAYTAPGPLHVTGEIVGEFDVAGRHKKYTLHVDGRTDGQGRFLHDAGEAGLIVNDGKAAYLYDRRRDAFATFDPIAARQPADAIEQSLIDVLLDENPALLLTLTTDPTALLRRSVTAIRPATQPATLVLERPDKWTTLRLRLEDGSIASAEVDFTPLMRSRKAAAIVAARATLTYQVPAHDAAPAAVFTWHPPASATEFQIKPELLQGPPVVAPTTKPVTR